MKKLLGIVGLLFSLLLSTYALAENRVVMLNISGAITPATQDYVQRGIAYANHNKATVIILHLDTPGGLDTSMHNIDKAILSSSVPVVTYVSPTGARAASAGTFILYASQIAAMAPGTNVGAASPVNLTGVNNESPVAKKFANDAAAYIRSLAELNGRNADWAESAVHQAASISSEQALKLKVINLIADNDTDLLKAIDGRAVKMHGTTKIIETHDAKIETVSHGWRYQFLAVITQPNIAYILLLLGIYGLFLEFYHPGLVLPGVVGVISILLAFYAFQLLPVSFVGLTLLMLGIFFMVMEVIYSAFGTLALGGIAAFALGSLLLFDTHLPGYSVAWQLILGMSILSALFFITVVTIAIRAMRKKLINSNDILIGMMSEVINSAGTEGQIKIKGEIWKVQSNSSLRDGQTVKITEVSGLSLKVEPVEKIKS